MAYLFQVVFQEIIHISSFRHYNGVYGAECLLGSEWESVIVEGKAR